MKRSRKISGFSLIEMVVYISILVFMLVIVLNVVVSVAKADRLIRSSRNVENSALVVLERVGRELRGAVAVRVASSTLDAHPGMLVLESEDSAGNERIVEFYLSAGRVYVREGGVELGALSGSDSSVASLIFRRFATSTIEGIRTELTVVSGTSTSYRSETFYSSALLR